MVPLLIATPGREPPDSGGFSDVWGLPTGPEKACAFAGHTGVALLNDAVSASLFPVGFPGA